MNPNAREFVPKGINSYNVSAMAPVPVLFSGHVLQNNENYYKGLYDDLLAEFQREKKRFTDAYQRRLDDYSELLRINENLLVENEELKKSYEALTAKYDYMAANQETLMNNYNKLEKKKGSMSKTTKSLLKENAALQDNNEQLHAELRHLRELNEEINQNFYNATMKNILMEESLEELLDAKQRASAAETRIRVLEEELAMAKDEVTIAKEEVTMAKEEVESHSLNCKMKLDTMQEGINNALQIFTTRCLEAEEQKNEAQSLLVTLYNNAVTQASETEALQQTLESLLELRMEENAQVNAFLSGYEERIRNLQHYNGITSTLYVPPRPLRRQIMNPELEDEDDYEIISA